MGVGPDLFIVGAPKCGTSALNEYLSAHPAIFMARKEQHFFGSDLVFRAGRPSAAEYFGGFAAGEDIQRRGDASVWYLYSRLAAEEIHAYNPQARVIAMLRNPVDMLYSMHSQLLYTGGEDIADFRLALAAERDRELGRRIPPGCGFPWALAYRKVGRYSKQLRRYLEVFGSDRVHVILFEDFRADSRSVYQGVLDFLEVEQSFIPDLDVVNANKRIRSETVRHLVRSMRRPPPSVRRVGRMLFRSQESRTRVDRVRKRLTSAATKRIERANTLVAPRPPMDASLRAELNREFTPDVLALAELLKRNLDHWLAPESEGHREVVVCDSAVGAGH